MSCAKTCQRKYQLRYVLRLAPERQSTPLRLGGAVHVGLDARNHGASVDDAVAAAVAGYAEMPAWAKTPEDEADWLTEREDVAALLRGYFDVWADSPLKVIASEIEFALPLRNAKGRKTGSYIAGKIDGIGRWNNELAVVEHKTTSDNIEPGSDYWRRLAIDQQISLYYYAAPELGFDVATVLYDVIRKPTIRLRKAETPAEYGVRLAADIAERPAYYYCRREIPRLRADLDEAMNEVRHMDLLLRHARRNNAWPRNTAVCVFPYRCEFFNLCCNGYDPAAGVPSGYVQLTTPHPELPNVPYPTAPAPAAARNVAAKADSAVECAHG